MKERCVTSRFSIKTTISGGVLLIPNTEGVVAVAAVRYILHFFLASIGFDSTRHKYTTFSKYPPPISRQLTGGRAGALEVLEPR